MRRRKESHRSEALTAVKMWSVIFWVVTPYDLLGRDSVWSSGSWLRVACSWLPTFRRNVTLPSSATRSFTTQKTTRSHDPEDHTESRPRRSHGVTTQKTTIGKEEKCFQQSWAEHVIPIFKKLKQTCSLCHYIFLNTYTWGHDQYYKFTQGNQWS
jgi:hypothetical protein